MVVIWVRPIRTTRHIDDGDIVLTNTRTVLLSDISGVDWTRQRMDRLTNAVQAQMDNILAISSLDVADPHRFEHEADPVNAAALLLAKYGGRVFYRGTDIVFRSTKISFTLGPDGDLVPHLEVVR